MGVNEEIVFNLKYNELKFYAQVQVHMDKGKKERIETETTSESENENMNCVSVRVVSGWYRGIR